MKKIFFISIILFALTININTGFSEENKYDHEVEFADIKGERILQFNGNGNVNITGYNGNKVLISSNENIFEQEDEEVNEKAKGLKRIGGGGFNIINNKQKNIIIISRRVHEEIDLDVKVPNNITLKFGNEVVKNFWNDNVSIQVIKPDIESDPENPGEKPEEPEKVQMIMKKFSKTDKDAQKTLVGQVLSNTLGGVFNGIIEGDIFIRDFSGLVEVSTVQGDIKAENIDGEVIASTVEGDIDITFKRLNKDRSLYFSTVNGDIDITIPKNTNADIMSRTLQGDVYSGFDGDVILGNEVNVETTRPQSLPFINNIFQSNYITTRINGGGQKIYLSTVNGDVYIRKGE